MSAETKIYWTKTPTRQYDPNLSESYIVGRRLAVPSSSGSFRDEYVNPFPSSLIKVGIHMSTYTDQDWFNISGSNWQLFDHIYSKPSIPESFVLDIGKTLDSGSNIIFDFNNTSNISKVVWLDYYFIK